MTNDRSTLSLCNSSMGFAAFHSIMTCHIGHCLVTLCTMECHRACSTLPLIISLKFPSSSFQLPSSFSLSENVERSKSNLQLSTTETHTSFEYITARKSTDGHVMFIEDLRKWLGIGADASDARSAAPAARSPPEGILIGHDMKGDLKKMKDDGIDIEKSLIYSGCIDTDVVIEDPDTGFSKSLSGLMEHYGFAKCHMSHPQRRKHAKRVFNGAHNVGNDAVAIAQGRDLTVKTSGSHDAEGDLDDH